MQLSPVLTHGLHRGVTFSKGAYKKKTLHVMRGSLDLLFGPMIGRVGRCFVEHREMAPHFILHW